jgi:chloride channel protein, CIC family
MPKARSAPAHDAATHRSQSKEFKQLGDFTTTPRVLWVSLLAVGIGVISSYVALGLLRLIGLFTNLFYYQRWRTDLVSPANNHMGAWAVLVPVAGAMIIGLMARYGSERIRGHGIPEAIEAILMKGSKVQPRVAILKPLSSAISIGSGGPFGAEGPIIMTGGAFGSIVAQLFHLTSSERKTLLVAGAAAGMAATFAAPLAAVLLAVELLLFEWKPRSFIPTALASVTAGAARRYLLGAGPLFPVPAHPLMIGPEGLMGCLLVGALAGAFSALLTGAVYASEDAFAKLPIHWMWWPVIGGLAIGLGGLIFPEALGVGYDTIGSMLQQSELPLRMVAGILLVKSTIWAISLGSGTSGGVLAPLLMMGGALGAMMTPVLPAEGAGFWPLVAMGAILGGTMRSPFTGVVFMIELTHDVNMMLPLLTAVLVAHAFTVLVLRRSILTEKISRRGYHLTREYSSDPLEILFVREVMRTNIVAVPENVQRAGLARRISKDHHRGQVLYPVVDKDLRLTGVITGRHLKEFLDSGNAAGQDGKPNPPVVARNPVVAYPDEPLRAVVYRMAETGKTRLPVVDPADSHKLLGLISLNDLLHARVRALDEERKRERVLRVRLPGQV